MQKFGEEKIVKNNRNLTLTFLRPDAFNLIKQIFFKIVWGV